MAKHNTRTGRDWFPYSISAEEVKKQVDVWAAGLGMWSITEMSGIVDGRLDLLLVPMGMDSPVFKQLGGHWTDRLGLIGVEVKVDKQDYANGLKNGQFERYEKSLSGLYIAGPPDVVIAKEVPKQYGVLTVGRKPYSATDLQHCVCRRHPRCIPQPPLTSEQMWRILWSMKRQITTENHEARVYQENLETRIKRKAGDAIWAALKKIEEN